VFVEVKTRSSELCGGALEAFDRDKRLAVARTAAAYLSRFSLWDRPCRFDLVAIERLERFPWWRPRHVVGAFRPDSVGCWGRDWGWDPFARARFDRCKRGATGIRKRKRAQAAGSTLHAGEDRHVAEAEGGAEAGDARVMAAAGVLQSACAAAIRGATLCGNRNCRSPGPTGGTP
jgi:hypothetical protein